jgi:hypothetical protein
MLKLLTYAKKRGDEAKAVPEKSELLNRLIKID